MGDVEFTRRNRGYDPEEVDRFVTSVRDQIGDLELKLRDLAAAPGRTAGKGRRDTGKLHDPDRAVERMLAAAQQTADRVVFDAEAEADRLVSEAEVEAERIVTDAQTQARQRTAEVEAQGEKIRREAVTEARRVVEETRQPLAREVRKLRSTRDGLRTEIEMLKRFLSDHRSRVRSVSESLRSLADDPASLRVARLGEPTAVDVDVSEDFEIEISPPPVTTARVEPITEQPRAAAAPAAATSVAAVAPLASVADEDLDDGYGDDDLDIDDTDLDVDDDGSTAEVETDGRATVVVDDDDDVDFSDAADNDGDTSSAALGGSPLQIPEDGGDFETVAWADDDDAADVATDDADSGDDDEDATVISGAFASLVDGADSEEADTGLDNLPGTTDHSTGDRFLSEVTDAAEDVTDGDEGGGFFESQFDD